MERSSSRRERRTHKRALRRHRKRLKLWLVGGPTLLVIGAVAALLIVFGGPQDLSPSAGQVPTSVAQSLPQAGANSDGLVVIEDHGMVRVFVLLHPLKGGGTVLGIPGATLTCVSEWGFLTLSELYNRAGAEEAARAIGEDLGAGVGVTGEVSWLELRQAAGVLAGADTLPESLAGTDSKEAQAVAEVVRALLSDEGAASPALSSQAMLGLVKVRSKIGPLSGEWRVAAVWGRQTSGADFAYLEPYLARARRALEGLSPGGPVSVEVRDTSGTVGLLEYIEQVLAPMGFNVVSGQLESGSVLLEQTKVVFPSWAQQEARDLCEILGITMAVEDPTLPDDRVVLAIGKDFVPALLRVVASER